MIRVRGACQNNLQHLDVDIPRGCIVAITGVSGSGKSSLVYDTLHGEAQRRYIESLSGAARQVLGNLSRPAVDAIEGLSPTLAVGHGTVTPGPRVTVGTLCEVDDFLRVVWAREGRASCPTCATQLDTWTLEAVSREILGWDEGTRYSVLAPLGLVAAQQLEERLGDLRSDGFARVRINGETRRLEEEPPPATGPVSLDLVIDRLAVKRDDGSRLMDSLEMAARHGSGRLGVERGDGSGASWFSDHPWCQPCDQEYPALGTSSFSPGSPRGMCATCEGLGRVEGPDSHRTCGACGGDRLSPLSLSVRVGDWTWGACHSVPAARLLTTLRDEVEGHVKGSLGARPLSEAVARLDELVSLGLGHLPMGRGAAEVSVGERHRLRLSALLASGLTGVVFVLDEPARGMHGAELELLADGMRRLRDQGNTVLVVTHAPALVRACDWVIDLGPGAGDAGGRLVATGPPDAIIAAPESVTGKWLAQDHPLWSPRARRVSSEGICLQGVSMGGDEAGALAVPTGVLTALTGVSGGEPSRVLSTVLRPALEAVVRGEDAPTDSCESIQAGGVSRLLVVDETGIASSPRSNPATFTRVFEPIRRLFSATPEAKVAGYGPGRFSFNAVGGRCETCQGAGVVTLDIALLPDVHAPCPACDGRRFNRATLKVRYRGHSIADVLAMSVDLALACFERHPRIRGILQALHDVGLGYMPLGQPATTLSAGEAHRVKLARELARQGGPSTLYLLEEPTAGLHPADGVRLLAVLQRLVDGGHTVVMVEHGPAALGAADHVLEFTPGPTGPQLMNRGTPEELVSRMESPTGGVLRATCP